jgi:hypothetical protein
MKDKINVLETNSKNKIITQDDSGEDSTTSRVQQSTDFDLKIPINTGHIRISFGVVLLRT